MAQGELHRSLSLPLESFGRLLLLKAVWDVSPGALWKLIFPYTARATGLTEMDFWRSFQLKKLFSWKRSVGWG